MRILLGGDTHSRSIVSFQEWTNSLNLSNLWEMTKSISPNAVYSLISSSLPNWCTDWKNSTIWSTICTYKCSSPFKVYSINTHSHSKLLTKYSIWHHNHIFPLNHMFKTTHNENQAQYNTVIFTWRHQLRNVLRG